MTGPLFVVGAPRSGTHLLRFCLNRHSRLHVAFETAFFRKIYGNRRVIPPRRFAEQADRMAARLFVSGDPTAEEYRAAQPRIAARIRTEARSYRDVGWIVLEELGRLHDKVRWGEKTPLHLFYADQIQHLFPDATVICMRRDPKNIVASYVKSSHLPADFERAVAQVSLCERAYHRFSDRLVTVSYEELTADPTRVLGALCDRIGERFEPAMLQPGMRDSSYGDAVMDRDATIGIEKDDPDKWRAVLSPGQETLVRAYCEGAGRVPRSESARRIRYFRFRIRTATAKNRLGFESVGPAARGVEQ